MVGEVEEEEEGVLEEVEEASGEVVVVEAVVFVVEEGVVEVGDSKGFDGLNMTDCNLVKNHEWLHNRS